MSPLDRLTSAVLWLAHNQLVPFAPLTAIGGLHMLTIPPTTSGITVAAVITLALAVGVGVALRMHAPLDDAGVPCPHCPLTTAEEDWA